MHGFFKSLGRFVSRAWVFLLAAWVSVAVILTYVAPKWDDVCQDGEFSFLPQDVPSIAAEKLFKESFPGDLLGSSIIIVVHRPTQKDGLLEQDRNFIEEILKPRIEQIAEEMGGLADLEEVAENGSADANTDGGEASSADDPAADNATDDDGATDDSVVPPLPEPPQSERDAATPPAGGAGTSADAPSPQGDQSSEVSGADNLAKAADAAPPRSIISRVRTFTDRALGNLLDSEDGKASLVLIELTTEFLEESNHYTVAKIEDLIAVDGPLAKEQSIPPGLELSLSGVAVVGRDMLRAAAQSASATEQWTFILVVILLVVIYRSFGLALIPLLTVGISVHIAIKFLSLLALWDWITPFHGMEIYISVVLYGAGVDYCLFLIARYIEELDRGERVESAIATTLDKVGAALVASAGTVTCGIGMMYFAEFGKFKQAGIGIAFSLVIVMLAALTFSPTLLRLFGRWVFWPVMRHERVSAGGGDWLRPANPLKRLIIEHLNWGHWERIGRLLLKAPARIWTLCVVLMIPLAVHGALNFDNLSYGLLSELPTNAPSVTGTKAVQDYFPAGATGPATVLIENPAVSFDEPDGIDAVDALTRRLRENSDELGLDDIRSVSHPLGGEDGMAAVSLLQRSVVRKRAIDFYVGGQGELADHVTRLDVVFKEDPFSRDSIQQLNQLNEYLRIVLSQPLRIEEPATPDEEFAEEEDADDSAAEPEPVGAALDRPWIGDDRQHGADVHFVGATASIRDLKMITDGDQLRIEILVLIGVFAILVLLLRRPAISFYLIISVFFSYFVSLGVTVLAFSLWDPAGFAGLDWKVPIFLFTILIAVGEDYNIFLMTRIDEEQESHGPVRGIVVALQKTGSIISSCGIIMAGTFSSLMAGSLLGMQQLGFALAFGVLLDTFVVRPILVPAYLILLHSGRFGPFGRFLGAIQDTRIAKKETATPKAHDHSLPR